MTWETTQPDQFEWLTVYFKAVVGHYLIFQFVEDNRVSVFVRSRARSNRGKLLLEIRDIKLVDNAQKIVGAVEATVVHSNELGWDDQPTGRELILAAWSQVEARVFKSDE